MRGVVAARRRRPWARRAEMTLRPAAVAMRLRKPCVRLRATRLGWLSPFFTVRSVSSRRTRTPLARPAAGPSERLLGHRGCLRGAWMFASSGWDARPPRPATPFQGNPSKFQPLPPAKRPFPRGKAELASHTLWGLSTGIARSGGFCAGRSPRSAGLATRWSAKPCTGVEPRLRIAWPGVDEVERTSPLAATAAQVAVLLQRMFACALARLSPTSLPPPAAKGPRSWPGSCRDGSLVQSAR